MVYDHIIFERIINCDTITKNYEVSFLFLHFFFNRGSEIYPPVSPYDMMNQIGASAPSGANDDVVGTTSALVMGASDPVVAGYNKDEGVVNLLLVLNYFSLFSITYTYSFGLLFAR